MKDEQENRENEITHLYYIKGLHCEELVDCYNDIYVSIHTNLKREYTRIRMMERIKEFVEYR